MTYAEVFRNLCVSGNVTAAFEEANEVIENFFLALRAWGYRKHKIKLNGSTSIRESNTLESARILWRANKSVKSIVARRESWASVCHFVFGE